MHQLEEQTFITSARHLHALHQAEKALTSFHQSLKNQAYEDMLAFELLQATKALGAIIGEVGTEDILDEIFSTFCVGK